MTRRQITLYGFSALAAILAAQPYRPVIVEGPSMSPTYSSGTLVFASRNVGDLHRDDVVVIRQADRTMIKRVAYLGGERFTEYRVASTWLEPGTPDAVRVCQRAGFPARAVAIPKGSVYVLGDNDGGSVDSREFGPIPKSDVLMKVVRPKAKVILRLPVGGYPPRVLSNRPIVAMRSQSE